MRIRDNMEDFDVGHHNSSPGLLDKVANQVSVKLKETVTKGSTVLHSMKERSISLKERTMPRESEDSGRDQSSRFSLVSGRSGGVLSGRSDVPPRDAGPTLKDGQSPSNKRRVSLAADDFFVGMENRDIIAELEMQREQEFLEEDLYGLGAVDENDEDQARKKKRERAKKKRERDRDKRKEAGDDSASESSGSSGRSSSSYSSDGSSRCGSARARSERREERSDEALQVLVLRRGVLPKSLSSFYSYSEKQFALSSKLVE